MCSAPPNQHKKRDTNRVTVSICTPLPPAPPPDTHNVIYTKQQLPRGALIPRECTFLILRWGLMRADTKEQKPPPPLLAGAAYQRAASAVSAQSPKPPNFRECICRCRSRPPPRHPLCRTHCLCTVISPPCDGTCFFVSLQFP